MPQEITTITLPLPLRLGTVNCYLIHSAAGHILIDTGAANQRARLEGALIAAGCRPGNLQLIILTHGDFDHTGNVAYLREAFGARVAMHRDDVGMLEEGDMFCSRKRPGVIVRRLAPMLFGFGKSARCAPDTLLADGESLSDYGWDATVLHLPGHSGGSIAILTAAGDLFCGDLLENVKEPALNSIMDDLDLASASIDRLSRLGVGTVYPGHGRPFTMQQFLAG
jgi:hydroxyacylglutathione hydrolase